MPCSSYACVLLSQKAGSKLTVLVVNIALLFHFIPKPDEAPETEYGLTLTSSHEAMKGNKGMEVVVSCGV